MFNALRSFKPLTLCFGFFGLHNNHLFFFVASKIMKEDELHMYDFMGDNGDEDGGIMLASEALNFDSIT